VPVPELASAQGEALGALCSSQQQPGVRATGRAYVRYHTFEQAAADVEIGIPVPVAVGAGGAGRVATGELPGGSVVRR
jgi:hypothetical protein